MFYLVSIRIQNPPFATGEDFFAGVINARRQVGLRSVDGTSAASNLLSLGCALLGTIDSDQWIRIVNDVGAPDMT